ncbi:hypothetical protein BC835DRAFT_1414428 [Cytidiella melzeri]|nr:hypothetical protein BC835DRAFT_1414428 [Cytidiella melzeri]
MDHQNVRILKILGSGRVEELHLRCRSPHSFLLDAAIPTYHHLSRLFLSIGSNSSHGAIFPPSDSKSFPMLTELHVRHVVLSWSRMASLGMLQILAVDYSCSNGLEYGLEVIDVLQALQAMPLLRHLSLAAVFEVTKLDLDGEPLQMPAVTLHNLEKFVFAGEDRHESDMLFNHIRFPGATAVKLRCDTPSITVPGISKLLDSRAWSTRKPIHKFYIYIGHAGPSFLRGRAAAPSTTARRDPRMPYDCEIEFPKAVLIADPWNLMMSGALSLLPLTPVRCLSISFGHGGLQSARHNPDPRFLTAAMPAVEVLRLAGSMKSFCALEDYLATPYKTKQWSATNNLPITCVFPHVTTLEIRNCVFTPCTHQGDNHYGCVNALREVLELRKTSICAPLKHLRVSRCHNFDWKSSQILQQVVPRLTWDEQRLDMTNCQLPDIEYGRDLPQSWRNLWADIDAGKDAD